jgi:SAM-dependent methyltransferase
MDRSTKLLTGLDRRNKILEIGAGYSPIVPRSDGWNSYALDHATQGELKLKYQDHNVPIDKIETVDFIWRSGPLDSAISNEHLGTFDACIASHVIEHSPDLIQFFRSCQRLLRPGGRLCLAIPDKRYCFDYFKPISMVADAVDAHLRARQRHTKKSVFETVAYNVLLDRMPSWGQQGLTGSMTFEYPDPLSQALGAYRDHPEGDNEPYRDLHGWYFTPSSFELMILELCTLDFTSYVIERIYPSEGCEFIAVLRAEIPPTFARSALNQQRLKLLSDILFEVREQADYVLGGLQPGWHRGP